MKVRRAFCQLAAVVLLTGGGLALSGGTATAGPDDCLNLPNSGTQLSCPPKGSPPTVPGVGLTGPGTSPGLPSIDEIKAGYSVAKCAATAAQAAASGKQICVPPVPLGGKPIPGTGTCYVVPPPKIDARTCNVDLGR